MRTDIMLLSVYSYGFILVLVVNYVNSVYALSTSVDSISTTHLVTVEPLGILRDLSGGHTVVGDTLELECNTTFMYKYVSIEWDMPEGVDSKSVKIKVLSIENEVSKYMTTSRLTIDEAKLSHYGIYKCQVVHRVWNYVAYSKELLVPVYEKDEHVLIFDKSSNSYVRSKNQIQVLIKAHPNISVTWYDTNNRTIRNGPSSRYIIKLEFPSTDPEFNYYTTLQFKNVTDEDYGQYVVVARNEFETVSEKIDAYMGGVISTVLTINSSSPTSVEFKCTATGPEDLKLKWFYIPCNKSECLHDVPKMNRFTPVKDVESHMVKTTRNMDMGGHKVSYLALDLSSTGFVACFSNMEDFVQTSSKLVFYTDKDFVIFGQNGTEIQSLYVGYLETVKIFCAVSLGTYIEEVRWYHDGTIIGTEDKPYNYTINKLESLDKILFQLSFTYVLENHVGNYSCEFLSRIGEVHRKTVTVVAKNLITLYPHIKVEDLSSGHSVVGDDIRLRCEIVFYKEVTVKWEKFTGGETFQVNFPVMQNVTIVNSTVVVTTNEITITQSTTGETNYSCVVNTQVNSLGNRKIVWVPVYGHNESVIVFDKSNSFFREKNMEIEMSMSVHPQPTIKWQYDNKKAEIIPDPGTKFRISNKQIPDNNGYKNNYKTTLIFTNGIQFEDFGNYTVVVNNGYKEENHTVLVNITNNLSVNVEFDKPEETKGKSTVRCAVLAYPEVPDISWYFAPSELQHSEKTKLERNETSSRTNGLQHNSYISLNLTEKGVLTCSASTLSAQRSVDREVFYVNGVSILNENTVNRESIKALESIGAIETTLLCAAPVGNFKKELLWYFHDEQGKKLKVYPEEYLDTYLYSTVAKINISHKATGDYYYTCNGLTDDGVLKSENLVVKIRDESYVFINKSNIGDCSVEKLIDVGSKWTIYCYSFGFPTPTVNWYKDNQLIIPSDRIHLIEYNQVLEIKRVVQEDYGTYTCEATNDFNVHIKSSVLTPTDPFGWLYVLVPILLLALLVIVVIFFYNMKLRKENELVQELKLAGLAYFESGDLKNLNPDLAIEDQADLLPYDKKWEIPKENIKLGKQLGSGAFGVVLKAEIVDFFPNSSREVVAVKTVSKHSGFECVKLLASEVKIMGHIGKHVNIVNLLGACTKNIVKKELFVVVEYCYLGNLLNYIQRNSNNFVDQKNPETDIFDWKIGPYIQQNSSKACVKESGHNGDRENYVTKFLRNDLEYPNFMCSKDFLVWAFQIARGMEYLASRRVVHGDLAARNVLLTLDNVVKVSDFGLSKKVYQYGNYVKKGEGPLPVKWLSVESLGKGIFSIKSDVWSFGVVLWEIFSLGETPYPGVVFDETFYKKLTDGYRMEQPKTATTKIHSIMRDCWDSNPERRPSFTHLAEEIGSLIDETLKNYYVTMNSDYTMMNKQQFKDSQDDYLTMITPPAFENLVPDMSKQETTKTDYINCSFSTSDEVE